MSTKTFIGPTEFFPGIGRIPYAGPDSDDPLAFKAYDENRVVGNKSMREHLRLSVCYWHSFLGAGADPFGPGTRIYPWDKQADPMDQARDRIDAAFEFGQQARVAEHLVEFIPGWFESLPVLAQADSYFLSGTFDVWDLTSIAIGAAAAYLIAVRTVTGYLNDE